MQEIHNRNCIFHISTQGSGVITQKAEHIQAWLQLFKLGRGMAHVLIKLNLYIGYNLRATNVQCDGGSMVLWDYFCKHGTKDRAVFFVTVGVGEITIPVTFKLKRSSFGKLEMKKNIITQQHNMSKCAQQITK